MTLDERYAWLDAISQQADVLLAEPEDLLFVTGILFTTAVTQLPRHDHARTIHEWVHHARHAIRARRDTHVSRH